jgi:mono/diheme cytochrome c family protein
MPVAGPADVARADEMWPGTTGDELDSGRSLYVEHCSACHRPVSPAAHTAEEWDVLFGEMNERAHLSDEDARLVKHYLITMAHAKTPVPDAE